MCRLTRPMAWRHAAEALHPGGRRLFCGLALALALLTLRHPLSAQEPGSPPPSPPGGEGLLVQPDHVWATLVPGDGETRLETPRVRVWWNPSPDPRVDGYRIRIQGSEGVLEQAQVGADTTWWESAPLQLQHPAPVVLVQAMRGARDSRVTQTSVPLHLDGFHLLAPLADGRRTELPPATVTALLPEPGTGHIWIGTDGAGLALLDPETGTSRWFTSADGLEGNFVQALHFSRRAGGDGEVGGRPSGLWVATRQAISRLDLSPALRRIESFPLHPARFRDLTLGGAEVNVLLEEPGGQLLIGTTADGLLVLDPAAREGLQVGELDELSNATLRSLVLEPGRTRVWMGTSDGVRSMNLARPIVAALPMISPLLEGLLSSAIDLQFLPDRRLLILTPEKLYSYHPETNVLKKLHGFAAGEEPRPQGLAQGTNGDLWVLTRRGLQHLRFGERRQELQRLEVFQQSTGPDFDLNSASDLSAIAVDEAGFIWLGTSYGRGILRFETTSGALRQYPAGGVVPQVATRAITSDATGQVWIGTERGLLVSDPARSTLEPAASRRRTPQDAVVPAHAQIHALAADEHGQVWIGHACLGEVASGQRCMARYEQARGFTAFPEEGFLRSDVGAVLSILPGAQDVFLGTAGAGLQLRSLFSGETYTTRLAGPGLLFRQRISALAAQNQTRWIGTSIGLFWLTSRQHDEGETPSSGGVLTLAERGELPEALRNGAIHALKVDPLGQLWVAGEHGLWLRTLSKSGRPHWTQHLAGSIDRQALSLDMDSLRRLWVGTISGLYLTASVEDGQRWKTVEPQKLLPDRAIWSVHVDAHGVVWVGTNQGLMLIPPFSIPSVAPPRNDSLLMGVAIVVVSLLGFLAWRVVYRHAAVVSVQEEPEILRRYPLHRLPEVDQALRRARRLEPALESLGLSALRWQHLIALARGWPGPGEVMTQENAEHLVDALMRILDGQLLPLASFLRADEPPSATPNPEVPFDLPGTSWHPDEDPSGGAPGRPYADSGFDLGAPGMGREPGARDKTTGSDTGGTGTIPRDPSRIGSGERAPATRWDDRFRRRRKETIRTSQPEHSPRIADPIRLVVRMPELAIRLVRRELPLFVLRTPLAEGQTVWSMTRTLREISLPARHVLLINPVGPAAFPPGGLQVPGTRFVPFGEEEIRSLAFSPSPLDAFTRHFIRFVRLTEVSPYSSKGEVSSPGMFFGRMFEIDKLLERQRLNVSIVGARQTGKSSLMGAVRRQLQLRGRKEVYAMTLTLQEDSRDFYRRFAILLQEPRVPANASEFAELMERHLRRREPAPLFFIDEVDGLLARERLEGYPVLTALRRLQQQGLCSFVLAGYWQLCSLGDDYHSPLFNMTEVIELGALREPDARELIEEPMHRLSLGFADPALVGEIVAATAGHPHLIQFVCNQLLELMTPERDGQFRRSDWETVLASDELKRYVTRNFKSNAGPLDELLVYLTLERGHFSHPSLERALSEIGLDVPLRAREESLRKLKLVGILKETDGKFEYALPLFRTQLLREDIKFFAESRARELRLRSTS